MLRLSAPGFTESAQLRKFSCDAQQPHLTVRILPEKDPRRPAGVPQAEGDTFRYRTERGEAVAVENTGGTTLWIAEYDFCGNVEAHFNTSAGIRLTSFVVSEIMDLPRLLLSRNAVVLHASFIVTDGEAILFTAKKQTGKTTQAALWERCVGARIINGDRAMIEKRGDTFYACGIPYSGTSRICLRGDFPIRAVVILSQGAENEARPAAGGEAFRALLSGCTIDTDNETQMRIFLQIAENIASSVPFFHLSCRPDEGAVACLQEALSITK